MSLSITECRNAVSLNEANNYMDVEILHPEAGWIPYTLNPDDEDMTIDNNALLALIGNNFTPFVPPTQEEIDAEKAKQIRGERNFLLSEHVDPIVSNPLRWADMTEGSQNAWTQYRQDLLNISSQSGFPHTVVWPTMPT